MRSDYKPRKKKQKKQIKFSWQFVLFLLMLIAVILASDSAALIVRAI